MLTPTNITIENTNRIERAVEAVCAQVSEKICPLEYALDHQAALFEIDGNTLRHEWLAHVENFRRMRISGTF